MQIFHIEDTTTITDVFSKICSLKNHVYISENDPEIGLKRILDDNYDLIFLDLFMPKISGFDILENLKQKNFDTSKIIILTATTLSDNQLKKLEKYNLREIIFKPISLDKILSIIENSPIEKSYPT